MCKVEYESFIDAIFLVKEITNISMISKSKGHCKIKLDTTQEMGVIGHDSLIECSSMGA